MEFINAVSSIQAGRLTDPELWFFTRFLRNAFDPNKVFKMTAYSKISITVAFFFTVILILFNGCAGIPRRETPETATVVWISFDGIRPDYLERAETPVFDRLKERGAFSLDAEPVFPSLTFPTHLSQATGARPAVHGVTGNSFYDNRTGRIHRFPSDSRLLEAEPVWLTAARQGVRTAVIDWPLSHSQSGEVRASHFGDGYARGLTDAERIGRLMDIWQNDRKKPPLRLLMGYGESPDKEGHSHGPDSPEVERAMEATDALLGQLIDQIKELWRSQSKAFPGPLYVIISSDHGMSETHTWVHPWKLTGLEGVEGVTIVTSANIAHLHFDQINDPYQRDKRTREAMEQASGHEFAQAFLRDELPGHWDFAHPHRTGDLVVVLNDGYTFSNRPNETTLPAREAGGPLGMHGYDPATTPEMNTVLFIYRYPEPLGSIDLGHVHHLGLHAAVCRLLNIEPSPSAAPSIPLPWLSDPAAAATRGGK